jgi:hypothetical protein
VIEGAGVAGIWLNVLKADDAAALLHGDEEHTARWKPLDEPPLIGDADFGIENGIEARRDDRVQNSRNTFRIVRSNLAN